MRSETADDASLPAILPIATETPAAIFTLGSYREVKDRLLGLTWGAEDLPAAPWLAPRGMAGPARPAPLNALPSARADDPTPLVDPVSSSNSPITQSKKWSV